MCEPCECTESKKYAGVKVQRAIDKVDFGFVDFGNITKELKQAENKHPVEEEGSQKTRLAAEVDLRR